MGRGAATVEGGEGGDNGDNGVEDAKTNGRCDSCHWKVAAPEAFWSACVPMDLEVAITAIEHSEMPGDWSP